MMCCGWGGGLVWLVRDWEWGEGNRRDESGEDWKGDVRPGENGYYGYADDDGGFESVGHEVGGEHASAEDSNPHLTVSVGIVR